MLGRGASQRLGRRRELVQSFPLWTAPNHVSINTRSHTLTSTRMFLECGPTPQRTARLQVDAVMLRGLSFHLASVCNEQIAFVAMDNTDWNQLWSTLASAAGDPNLAIGVGSLCRAPDDYPRSYREAQRALSVVGAKGSMRYEDLGLLGVLMGRGHAAPRGVPRPLAATARRSR